MATLPPSPFIDLDRPRFNLDEDKFMNEIEPVPSFLSNPRPEYLRAVEIVPILEILAGY